MNHCIWIKEAGIVGAGGAGFPTHLKLSRPAQIVIANGAECEPLLETDRHLLLREMEKVISGLRAAMDCTGAKKGIIAIKDKHQDILQPLGEHIRRQGEDISLHLLDNFYPAGDEQVLVYETTGRVVPMGGIPLDVGAVVCNVYTLSLLAGACAGEVFTHRYVTVTGDVRRPAVARLPIGMSIGEAIQKVAGGAVIPAYKVIVGGPMMGKIENNLDQPILKTTGGIIVLPEDHRVVRMKCIPMATAARKAKSVCCQCSYCTELCPRFLMGHSLHPHRTMRMLSANLENMDMKSFHEAALCSDCGLCSAYSCTMGLSPNLTNGFLKGVMRKNGIKPDFRKMEAREVHDLRDYRKVSTSRLISRLDLSHYDHHLSFIEEEFAPSRLELPLKQHIGAPSVPVVEKGSRVKAGDLLAMGPDQQSMGTHLHCGMDGIVREVSDRIIVEKS